MKKSIILILILSNYFIYGQVTSVGISAPADVFDVTGSPVTTFGTLSLSFDNQDESEFFAAPFVGAGAPIFRLIVADDLPEADFDERGIVNISTQSFGGLKTYNDGIGISTNNRIYFSGTSFIQAGGTGDESVFLGKDAGGDASGGHDNVGIGYNSLKNLSNTIGEGNHNTAVGFNALLSLTSALQNTMVGSGAGDKLDDTGCDGNTGVGFEVLGMATDAKYNVMIGLKAGKEITTGDNNTYIGYECGKATTTGVNNTFLGYLAGATTETGDYNILIGDNVNTTSATSSNQINIGNTIYGNRTADNVGIGINNPAATLHLKAGTTSANTAPIKIEVGTVNTTAEAGTIEYDGKTFYTSPNATTGRGIAPSVLFVINNSDVSLANSTAAQSIFNTANDQISLAANTTYFFEMQITITGMSTTTRTINYVFGGTAGFSKIYYTAQTWSGAASAIATDQTSVNINSSGSSTINITNTSAETTILIKGSFRTIATGTFIPQIAFSAAPGVLGSGIKCIEGSYLNLTPVGTNSVSFAGNWN